MKYCKLVILLLILCLHGYAQGTTPVVTDAGFFSFTHFNFWDLLAYILFIALALYTWLVIKPKIDSNEDEIGSLKTRFSTYIKANAQPGVNDVKKQVEMLVANHPKWGDAQEEINALVSRIETLEAARQPVVPVQEAFIKKEKRNIIEVFYMTFPVGNYFPISAKSDSRENTIYKFKVRPNKTEADFEVHTAGAPIQDLIGLAQTYIKPACDEENMPSQQTKNIVTSQAGLAVLEGDKWIIKKKALIRYE